MLIIVCAIAVDLLIDASTGIIRGVRTNISVGVFVDVNVIMFGGVMTAFEFAMSGPLEEFRC